MREHIHEIESQQLDTQSILNQLNQVTQSQSFDSIAALKTPTDLITANSASTQDALVKLTEL